MGVFFGKQEKESGKSATTDIKGAGSLDVYHMYNFLEGIRKGEKLNAPVNDGAISVNLCHLGNISQKTGRMLNVDPASGKIIKDKDAAAMCKRDYEPGWEPKV